MTTLEAALADPRYAGAWALDAGRSTVGFRSRSFWGLLPVNGSFGDVTGDGQLLPSGSVLGRVDIAAASLSTGIGKRDEHLRSSDFFDVERFPRISVEVSSLAPGTGDAAELRATLTVKGTQKALAIPATIRLADSGTVRISARAKIDRTDWDVTGNLLGMVAKPTQLTADLVFTKNA